MLLATAAYLQVIGHNLGKTAKPACRCKHLQHSSKSSDHAFALWVMRPSSRQSRLWQPSQITNGLHQVLEQRHFGKPWLGFWISGQQNDGRHEYTKSEPFNVAGYALTIPLNESYTIRTRNSFPPEDFETTMWSMATCSPNLERSDKSDSGPGTRWLRILFEKSLARLQMSHKGCFGKWLIRCSIETASALARTTASESIGRGSSGATSLTSAALDERSPKSPGSTAGSTDESGTTGSSRSSGGVSTRKSSARCSTAAGTPGITSKLDWKKGTFWETLDA